MVQPLLELNVMHRHLSAIQLLLGGYVLCLGTLHADIKVKTDYDKAFDFKQPKTWGWNDTGAGKVVMARWANENPEELRGRAEPVIKEAVAAEFARLKLQPATTGTPDLKITYHLLITLGSSAQTMGQFVPSVAQWGLPPFPPATQALEAMNLGSFVIDLTAQQSIVWRGVAQAKLKIGTEPKKRQSVLREAVRDLLKKFPPK